MKKVYILTLIFFVPCIAMDKLSQESWNSTATTEPYSSLDSMELGSLGNFNDFNVPSLSAADSQEDDQLEELLSQIQLAEQQGTLEPSETLVKNLENILSDSNAQMDDYEITDYTNNERIISVWNQFTH